MQNQFNLSLWTAQASSRETLSMIFLSANLLSRSCWIHRALSRIMVVCVQIFPLNEKIENINDQYWTLRAEEVDPMLYSMFCSSANHIWPLKMISLYAVLE